MKPLTVEWVEKGEADFRSAQRELRVRSRPNHDLVCFLSQQCAEKCLKALLVEAGLPFPKTHDLLALLKLLTPVAPVLVSFRKQLELLNDYAVEFRYPGETAIKKRCEDRARPLSGGAADDSKMSRFGWIIPCADESANQGAAGALQGATKKAIKSVSGLAANEIRGYNVIET